MTRHHDPGKKKRAIMELERGKTCLWVAQKYKIPVSTINTWSRKAHNKRREQDLIADAKAARAIIKKKKSFALEIQEALEKGKRWDIEKAEWIRETERKIVNLLKEEHVDLAQVDDLNAKLALLHKTKGMATKIHHGLEKLQLERERMLHTAGEATTTREDTNEWISSFIKENDRE